MNGESVLSLSAFKNHRAQAVIDLFAWVAANRPNSYGLVYVRDEEDRRGGDNAFREWRIARGRFESVASKSADVRPQGGLKTALYIASGCSDFGRT